MEGDGDADGHGGWAGLTRELLIEVLRKLSLEDRYKTAPLVCKTWMRVSREPACWEKADLEDWFQNRNHNNQKLKWWLNDFEKKVDSLVLRVVHLSQGRLRELYIRHGTDNCISYLADNCPNLQCLAIRDSPGFTDMSASQLASKCLKLEYLDFSGSHWISVSMMKKIGENCKYIATLKRNVLSLKSEKIMRSFAPQQYLKVGSIFNRGVDEEANSYGSLMPNLKHLELAYSSLTDSGLCSIIEGCTLLEHLDVYGCELLSQAALALVIEKKKLKNFKYPQRNLATPILPLRYGHWQLYSERFTSPYFFHL